MDGKMIATILLMVCLFGNGQTRVLDDKEKIEVVKMHNLLRRSVVPTASNMIALTYSDEIAEVAAQYGDKCTFAHMYGSQGYGENGRLATDANITNTVVNWFQERVYYDWNKPYGERCYVRDSKDDYLPTISCGHYTMLTTYSITKVGCAINYCPTAKIPNKDSIDNVFLTFCFYDKGPRDHPYSPGKPCTGCDDMFYQTCLDGLCVNKKTAKSECKVVCKRCQEFASFIPGMCGCICDVGDNNDCSAADKYTEDPTDCLTCDSLGTPCLNGGKDVSNNRDECQCNCHSGFSGKNCEIDPTITTNLQNSVTIKMNGQMWNYGFRIPVDIYEFERQWNGKFKKQIEIDITGHCKSNKCGVTLDTTENLIVDIVQGYPILDERGTLILPIYSKKNGQFIDKGIIRDVMSKNSGKENSYLFDYVNF